MIAATINDLIKRALAEDLGSGDHSSIACIPANSRGKARLLIKETGIIAGIEIASYVFSHVDERISIHNNLDDGTSVKPGDTGFIVEGPVRGLLKSERLVLNIMQRMSGIATTTGKYVNAVRGYKARILDTRKTTPGFRVLEKEAVRLGGGINHRMGLYDMIMLKDNHIDYAGGIVNAINKVNSYLEEKALELKIVIEVRSLDEVKQVLDTGRVDRIMLDNFSIADTKEAVGMIGGKYPVESSGGINLRTIRSYAACGVDYISVGALTHQLRSMDISLKAL
ncbi:MAG: carboxylating nicotinate-nucleotide diphosphorylase [Bacteroidales bacterium]|nr:carboxylating nicotinate-nucleotide diphosphorylase [Bacteroidales bacterium]